MKNKNKLSQKMRNFKKLAEFAAKLQRDPRTKNFVGFAAVVVLVCVAFSFATDTPNETEKARPGQIVTLSRDWTFHPYKNGRRLDGFHVPAGTKAKYVSPSKNGLNNATLVPLEIPSKIQEKLKKVGYSGATVGPEVVPSDCIVELGGTPEPPKSEMELRRESATLQEIIAAAKTGDPLITAAQEGGEKIKELSENAKYIAAVKYISVMDTLKKIDAPVTTTESFSLRPKFEELGIHPRKSKGGLDVCALHAMAVNLEYLYKQSNDNQGQISLAYLSWLDTKNPNSNRPNIEGASLKLLIKGINKYGVCSENAFPKSRIGSTPSPKIQSQAITNKKLVVHGAYNWIPGYDELESFPWNTRREIMNQIVMHEIKNGRPVLSGCKFPKEYDGDMTKYTAGKHPSCNVPHAVLIVGYKTTDGTIRNTVYEFLNSRGETWGFQGYGIWGAQYLLAENYSLSLE